MSLNAATIEYLLSKGLSGADLLEVAQRMEKKRDNTNAERQARFRRGRKEGKSNAVTVTPVTPPNEEDILTPREIKNTPPKGGCKKTTWPCPPNVPEQVWIDFLASPKRRKAGMSDTAYAGITNNLKTLAEHGYPPGKMLALAVERGWITVKLEWVQNDEQANRGSNQRMGRHQPDDGLSSTARAAIAVFGPPSAGHF